MCFEWLQVNLCKCLLLAATVLAFVGYKKSSENLKNLLEIFAGFCILNGFKLSKYVLPAATVLAFIVFIKSRKKT